MSGTVGTEKGDFCFNSIDQALEIIKNAMTEEKEIWISMENKYPCEIGLDYEKKQNCDLFYYDSGDHACINRLWKKHNPGGLGACKRGGR